MSEIGRQDAVQLLTMPSEAHPNVKRRGKVVIECRGVEMRIEDVKALASELIDKLKCNGEISVECDIGSYAIEATNESGLRNKESVHCKIKKTENTWLKPIWQGVLPLLPYVTMIWLAYIAKNALEIIKGV